MTRNETNIDIIMAERNIRYDSDLAKEIGMDQNTLTKRLRGDISMNTLEMLSNHFGVPLKDMIR